MDCLQNYRLLVVDDEELLRDSIVFDLKRKGFTVFSVESSAKAMDIVRTSGIHLVISDMRMPGGDGLSLLAKIREFNPTVPVVIFITGFADASEAECLAKGARSVVQKPFDRKSLMNTVFDALGLRKAG